MTFRSLCLDATRGQGRASCLATGNHERKSYRVASGPRLLRNHALLTARESVYRFAGARAVLLSLSLPLSFPSSGLPLVNNLHNTVYLSTGAGLLHYRHRSLVSARGATRAWPCTRSFRDGARAAAVAVVVSLRKHGQPGRRRCLFSLETLIVTVHSNSFVSDTRPSIYAALVSFTPIYAARKYHAIYRRH